MKYKGNGTNIGVSKVQGLVDLKSDLRGYRLNGVKPLKPVDPLFSDGITGPSHHESASFLGQNNSQPRDEVFEEETYKYVKSSTVIPSWIRSTKSDPDLNKSVAYTQRKAEEVHYVTELDPDGTLIPRQYIKGEEWATGSKKYQTETIGNGTQTHWWSQASSALSKNQRFKIDPVNGTANAFYGRPNQYEGKFDFPGGTSVGSLEYNKSLVEEELGLIPFCITTITPNIRTYLNFPAHLENYEDNYTGNWDSVQYVGRAENFWGYTGFNREISLSFKVLATNPQNLADLYSRLNRLAGGTAPSYTQDGLFMRGTLASITLGDLLRNQVGFIRSVRLSLEQDVLWELGPVSPRDPNISEAVRDMYSIAKTNVQDGFEGEYYRIPQMLNVSLGFTPIEHGTVREDYNAYFVFDNKELTKTETGTPEHKEGKVEKKEDLPPNVTLHLPGKGDMWFKYDENGNFQKGGMVSDRANGIDPLTRQPFWDPSRSLGGIPFNPIMF